jgi:hypothetical protein
LAATVVSHLGESLTLAAVAPSVLTTQVQGVLVQPEASPSVGNAKYVIAQATLTIRTVDTPAWFRRGVTITNEAGEVFKVSETTQNGEGITEAILTRVS